MSIYDNATPGHCVVCGKRAKPDLCAKCAKEWRDRETGKLPEWLSRMRNDQNNRAVRERRNAKRAETRPVPVKRAGRGRPANYGVSLVYE